MPYPFVDGQILNAADLNALASNAATVAASAAAIQANAQIAPQVALAQNYAATAALSAGAAASTDPSTVGAFPRWVRVGNALPYTAFQTAATTVSVTLFSLIASGVIHAIKIKHSTAFTGGAISALTLSVGIAGTVAKYATAHSVFAAPSATNFFLDTVIGSENCASPTTIVVAATSTGANLSALTAGVVDVYALLSTAA